jgi:DNA-binding transcriptional regulator YdaS (Cro superfamily)
MSKIDLEFELHNRDITLAELATIMGVNRSTVTRWNQRRIPAERVISIEQMTGISRHDLRPDIYPVES